MSGKMIGIELGADALKLAVVRKGKILKMAAETIPAHLISDGRVAAPEVLSQFLKGSLKKNRICGRKCALVLPSQLVVSQRLMLPHMTEAELKLNLPYEFRDYIGSHTNDYTFDYIVTDLRDGMMDLYAVAVRKQDMEDYYQVFRGAGLTLRLAMPAEMAWLNVVRDANRTSGSLCIVDVGHEKTCINIYRNNRFVMGKYIDLGGNVFDEILAGEQGVDTYTARSRKETNVPESESLRKAYDAVATEILKTLTFYSYAEAGERVRELYLCGGSANVDQLRRAIGKATDLEPCHISGLLSVADDQAAEALRCGLAAGAAMQHTKEA